jgi:hypothetical protein
MKKNPKGIIMFRKTPTTMNRIFAELLLNKPYRRNDTTMAHETEKWYIFTYGHLN